MPRLRKARSSSLLLLSSSSGTRWGSASTMVTSAPNERQTDANSQPMAPAPRMTTEPGIVSMPSASSLVMTREWSISSPGIERGTEPVASRTWRASIVRPSTSTAVGETRRPWPWTTSILRLFTRPVRPLNSPSTTLSLYLLTPPMSTDSKVPLTPNCADSLMTSTVSAECSSALVGMQPRCRQVPPTLSFSTMTTVMPSSAARRAAAYPPLPPPRTTRSTVSADGWVTAVAPRCGDRRVRLLGSSRWPCVVHPSTVGAGASHPPDRPRGRTSVGLLDRLRRADRPGTVRGARSDDVYHLEEWAGSRRGVEGFVEPQTSTTATTLVLVAGDGEWTRRRVDSPKAAFSFGTQDRHPGVRRRRRRLPAAHARVDRQAQGRRRDRPPDSPVAAPTRGPSCTAITSPAPTAHDLAGSGRSSRRSWSRRVDRPSAAAPDAASVAGAAAVAAGGGGDQAAAAGALRERAGVRRHVLAVRQRRVADERRARRGGPGAGLAPSRAGPDASRAALAASRASAPCAAASSRPFALPPSRRRSLGRTARPSRPRTDGDGPGCRTGGDGAAATRRRRPGRARQRRPGSERSRRTSRGRGGQPAAARPPSARRPGGRHPFEALRSSSSCTNVRTAAPVPPCGV